jgi:hypothetical protein
MTDRVLKLELVGISLAVLTTLAEVPHLVSL